MTRGAQALALGSAVSVVVLLLGVAYGLGGVASVLEADPTAATPHRLHTDRLVQADRGSARYVELAAPDPVALRAADPAAAGAPILAGCAIALRVVTPDVGELEFVLRRGSFERGHETTRAGRLRFGGLEPGTYLLRAVNTGRWMAELAPGEEWSSDEFTWRRVEVSRRTPRVDIDVRFVRTAALAGVVRGPAGRGIPGTTVLIQDTRRPARVRRAPTDELGSFLVEGLTPAHYSVTVADPGSPGFVALPVDLTLIAAETGWVELRVESGQRTVFGRVADPLDQGVEGIRVVCAVPGAEPGTGRPPASRIVARARTDARGAFRFEGLPAARLSIVVDAREMELLADGQHRRLRGGFAPRIVDTVADDVDLGVLAVERAVRLTR